jgi:Ser/Thr protein kinase RdoA (MazF antagonist)
MHDTESSNANQDFAALSPDIIMDAVESLGLVCDARIFTLNSYENRVYQIGIENQSPLIGKFYRPQRWTDEQILEEHAFTEELAQLEIPVVAPLRIHDATLLHFNNYRFALYPRQGGRAPELDNREHLHWLGRFMGRIHAVGAAQAFKHRPGMDISTHVITPSTFLLQQNFIPDYLRDAYRSIIEVLIPLLQQRFAAVRFDTLRIHGDCHPGNILWLDKGPHFVDFDDSRTGPAIQDLWMLLSGEKHEQKQQLNELLDGYCQFHDFNDDEISLIEPLRTLRLVHYSGWLAQRWSDPAFPRHFPWFNTPHYWEQYILQLKEQMALLQDE